MEINAKYFYDPFSRRIAKNVKIENLQNSEPCQKKFINEHLTIFLWIDQILIQEISQNLNITYLHEPELSIPLAKIISNTNFYFEMNSHEKIKISGDQIFSETHDRARINYYNCDQLGTPKETFDEKGDILWIQHTKAWGSNYIFRENEFQPIKFRGQYEDLETGLYYNIFRYYDSTSAGYTTQDPIGLSGGLNLYAYAPNPTGWTDALGLKNNCQINISCDPCFGKNPAAWASQWQGHGAYKGVDSWRNIVLAANSTIFGGLPGQSGFYFNEKTLNDADESKKRLGQLLQILPHRQFGFRSYVQKYKLKKDTCVAVSIAQNQDKFKFGTGGGTQYFLADYKTKLSKMGNKILLN